MVSHKENEKASKNEEKVEVEDLEVVEEVQEEDAASK
jgi:hypothetical protein